MKHLILAVLEHSRNATGDLRVTTKLVAAFAIMGALTVLVNFEGLRASAMLDASSKSLFEEDLTGISAIKEAGIFQVKCTRVLRDLVLATGDKEVVEDQNGELTELEASVDDWLNVAQKAFPDSQSQKMLKKIKLQLPTLRSVSANVAALAKAGDQKGALMALKGSNKISNEINLTIAEICRLRENAAKDSRAQCEVRYRFSRLTMWGGTIFSVLFAIGLSLLCVRMIAGPLLRVVATLQKAAAGDLTQRLKIGSRDEIGTMSLALNQMLESTRAVLQNANDTATKLGTLSVELAKTADGLAQGAQAQAAGLEETSASLEQISVTARNNAEHARLANRVANQSREVADKGRTVVAASVLAMSDIHDSSEKISRIASAVDEVAFQTNLLSINAAIEAARAGEEGKSFAVVAEEIRHLSKRSAGAARDIRKLIGESVQTVEKGSASIHDSGETLKGLSSSVNEVTALVEQIACSSEEQRLGVEQVHSAVLQMDKVTQVNATQAANLTSAASSLSGQAANLLALLNRFVLDVESQSSTV